MGGNINGISFFERIAIRHRLRKEGKNNPDLNLTKADRKEFTDAIKSKDPEALEKYLASQDAQIRGAMGLALKGTVNDPARAREIAEVFANDVDAYGKPVDVEKLARYINMGNVERIAENQVAFAGHVQGLETNNSRAMAEQLFNSGLLDRLDSEFGIS